MVKQEKNILNLFLSACLALSFACEPKKMEQAAGGADASAASEDKLDKFFPDNVLLPAAEETVDDGSSNSSVTDVVRITKLEIFPARIDLVMGTSKSLRATAVFSNGEKKVVSEDGVWSSANSVVGRFEKAISKNTVLAVDKGMCDISFIYDGIEVKAELNVSAKILDTIEIEPKVVLLGENTKFNATAIFSDGSLQDITADVTWQSQNPNIASVVYEHDKTFIRGNRVGNFSVTAVYQGFSGQNQVRVLMPDIQTIDIEAETTTLIYGSRPRFKAIATLKSGNIIEVSSSVTWACENTSICQFSSQEGEEGVANLSNAGTTPITASFDANMGSLDITVTNTNYISYSIEPANAEVPINLPVKFTAYGHAADGSQDDISDFVIWSVSNEFLATITNDVESPGMLTGLAQGNIVVGAKYGDQNFATEAEVVAGALIAIEVTATNPSGTCGVHEPIFKAKGKYSDNSEQDISAQVTWSSADPTLASVSNASETKGKVTTFKKGSAYIKASLYEPLTQQTISGQNTVTATDPVLVGYTIRPQKNSVAIGEKIKFYAEDQFSCEITNPTDRTAVVQWESGNLDYLVFNNATNGEASTYGDIVQQVVVSVSANFNGLSGTFDFPIRVKELSSLSITSDHNISDLEVLATEQFRVSAIYSNGITEDVTNPIGLDGYVTNWQVTMSGFGDIPASIDNDVDKGLLTGITEGTIDVKAVVTINNITRYKTYEVNIISRCLGGNRFGLYCWYLGPKGQNCENTCSLAGANHIAKGTIEYIGSFGNGQNCTDALAVLGIGGTLSDNQTHPQNKGLGCSVYSSAGLSIPKRMSSPDTNATDFDPAFRRVCACDQ